MLQTEQKEEYEDPPGQRPPHLWEGLIRGRWNGCCWQLSCYLDVEDFARVIHLATEEVGGFLIPGLFRADVSLHSATRIDLDGAIRLIRGRVTPLVSELSPQLGAQVGHHPQRASPFRYYARARIAGYPCAQFSCVDTAHQLTGIMEVVR